MNIRYGIILGILKSTQTVENSSLRVNARIGKNRFNPNTKRIKGKTLHDFSIDFFRSYTVKNVVVYYLESESKKKSTEKTKPTSI